MLGLQAARTIQFTVGYPVWNATDACCDLFNTGIDDAGILRGLIEEIGRQFAMDVKQVYLIGHSDGGFMGYWLPCQSADRIARFAGYSFLDLTKCALFQPIKILHIQATVDATAPDAGGVSQSAAYLPQAPGAPQTVSTWAGNNGATGLVLDAEAALNLTTDLAGLDMAVARSTNSPPGSAVELWTILGGSHRMKLSSEFGPRIIDWLLAYPKP